MALGDDEWLPALMAREGEFETPPFTEAAYQFGLTYPWDRPAHSYLLRDGEVRPIADYGAVPAILFHSPGTTVRAAIIWLTPLQVETVVFAELGYRIGRLDHAQFEIDEVDVGIDTVFAFIGRTGALRLDGEPVALAAVPACDRTARAMTQEELLQALGFLAFGPGTTPRDLARRCFEDHGSVVEALLPQTAPHRAAAPG